MNTSLSDTGAIGTSQPSRVRVNPVRAMDNARSLLRVVQRFSGAALVLAALGLWIVPGASWAAELALVKLAVSLGMGFTGLALWQIGTNTRQVEIELDTESLEARVIMNSMGRSITILNCRFNDLSRVDVHGNTLKLWDCEGNYLAEVDMCRPEVRDRLLRALEDAGLMTA